MGFPEPPPILKLSSGATEQDLLDRLRDECDLSTLREIARNDSGEEIEEHLEAILKQLSPDPPHEMLAWNPREVLELERWNEPECSFGAPPEGKRGHRKRLLACTILLRNVATLSSEVHSKIRRRDRDREFYIGTSAASVLRLCSSAVRLGDAYPQLALDFLIWVEQKVTSPDLHPFVAFGCLLLAATRESLSLDDVQRIFEWLQKVEQQARAEIGRSAPSDQWLFGLNSYEAGDRFRTRWSKELEWLIRHTIGTRSGRSGHLVQELCHLLRLPDEGT